jgi:hypothetical protein
MIKTVHSLLATYYGPSKELSLQTQTKPPRLFRSRPRMRGRIYLMSILRHKDAF